MNYTSIEQSKKLLELGLNPESADFYYVRVSRDTEYSLLPIKTNELRKGVCSNISDYITPCWSVGALLEVIPKHPKFNTALRIIEGKDIIWTFECHAISEYEFKGTSDLECLYNAVVWLLENNYIKQ